MTFSDGALRRAALFGVIVLLVVVAAEHLAAPSLDPERNRVSEYVNTSAGALMVAGFAAWALSLAALAELARRDGRGALAALLALAAAGVVVTALFPTQTSAGVLPPGTERSLPGRLHDLASGVLTLALVAAAAASIAAIRSPRAFRRLVIGLLILAGVLAGALDAAGAPGLRQRVLIVAACGWQLLVLWALAPRPLSMFHRCTRARTS